MIVGKVIIMHYYIMFDIMHYFASDVGFTNIVVGLSERLVQRLSLDCHLCEDNADRKI